MPIKGPSREGFVVSYDVQGHGRWLVTNGGPSTEICEDVAMDRQGNILYGGGFRRESNFGRHQLTVHPDNKTGQDIFVAKFGIKKSK